MAANWTLKEYNEGGNIVQSWFDETGAPAIFQRAGYDGVNGGWGVGAQAQDSPFTSEYAKLQPAYDAAQQFTPTTGWQNPTMQTPWYFADGKYIIPETGLEMDAYNGLPQSQSYLWGKYDDQGTAAVPVGDGQLVKLSGIDGYGYGKAYDTQPGVRKWFKEPEESVFSQLTGGNNADLPWYIPKGSPLMMIGGVAGVAASAAGAAGGATSALGGTEASGALGGSATGAGGTALSFSDLLPQWMQQAGSSTSSTGTSWLDSLKNFISSDGSAEVPWGINPQSGGNVDWTDIFSGGGGDVDLWGAATESLGSGMGSSLGDYLSAGGIGTASTGGLAGILQSIQQSTGLTTKDALSMLGKLGAAGLGAYASNQQSNALSGLAGQYSEMGAPYRAMLASSYANPNAFLANDPSIQASVNQGTNAMARALSTRGNPAQSGTALNEINSYAANNLYGQLGNERNRLANFGGLSNFNAAAPQLQTSSIGQDANMYNALGYGLQQVTAPSTPSLTDLYKAFGLTGLT